MHLFTLTGKHLPGLPGRSILISFIMVLFVLSNGPLSAQTYRSISSGSWSNPANWEVLVAVVWTPTITAPTGSGVTVDIRAGHTINLTDSRTINKATVSGMVSILSGGSISIANAFLSPGEMTINAGGTLQSWGGSNYSSEISYASGTKINIGSQGKIIVGTGGAVTGTNLNQYATGTNNVWSDGAVFDWNSTTALPASGLTYFPGVASSVKPILIVDNTGGSIGGSGATSVNGMLSVRSPFSLVGSGSKTIRDGIVGNSVLTIPSTSGAIVISGSAPILGGSNLSIITDKSISIPNGVRIPSDSSVNITGSTGVVLSGKVTSDIVIDGVMDMGTATIDNSSGTVTINGTLKTAHPLGLEGGTINTPSVVNVNSGSTIEYNAAGNQLVTASAILEGTGKYSNIVFSGSGIKSLNGIVNAGTNVKISGTAIADALLYNLGSAAATLTMEGGRLQLGTTGTQPIMAGTYNLTGGTVQFGSNSTPQIMRGGSAHTYFIVEVAGSNVSTQTDDIFLKPAGIFTIKNTGVLTTVAESINGPIGTQAFVMEAGAVLMCRNEEGFYGGTMPGKFSSVGNTIENVQLAVGSTINYSRAGAQKITSAIPYQHLILSGSGTKTPGASGILQVSGNLSGESGAQFIHNDGTVEMTGSSIAQTYSANNPFDFFILRNNNPINLIINADASIKESLLFGTSAKLRLNGGNIHIRSTIAKTAQVGAFAAASSITYNGGYKFYIERFIKTPSKWHLVSIPVADAAQTVKSAWAEGQNAGVVGTAGLGTNITGPAGAPNLDFASPGYSLKYWDANIGTAGNFTFVQKKDTAIAYPGGYFLYVRGDRAATATGPFGTTTLRTSGQLFFNPSVPVVPGRMNSVGNPLPSAVDLRSLGYSPGGLTVGTVIYLWDPAISGNYSVGGYQALTYNGTDFIITPGGSGSSAYPASGAAYNTIQSGQAFFMKDAVVTQVSFPESAKVSGSLNAGRQLPEGWQRITAGLFTDISGSPVLVDGAAVELTGNFSNLANEEDAAKMDNSNENISFYRNNKKLVVERHAFVSNSDTFYVRTERLKKRSYTWNIAFMEMQEGLLEAWLADTYTNSRTALSLSGNNIISFVVNDSVASAGINRFYIIMKTAAVLPVNITAIKAREIAKDRIEVKWIVSNEMNMATYEVERSTDGRSFKTVGRQMPLFSNGGGAYTFTDQGSFNGILYYRIKAISISGFKQFSSTVKVEITDKEKDIAIFPNPSSGNNVNIVFKAAKRAGEYLFTIHDIAGKQVHQEKAAIAEGSGTYTVTVNNPLAPGEYQLQMTDVDGKTATAVLIVSRR